MRQPDGTAPAVPFASWGVLALVAIAVLRVVATYGVFGQTFDEPAHIACGVEIASSGRYTLEPQHPPLGRIPIGIAARLAGATLPPAGTVWQRGNAILYAGSSYIGTLSAARAGTLPFLIAIIVVTWTWARRLYGERVALLAALFVSTTPALLGHGALATNDVALAAAVVFALDRTSRYLDAPTFRNALWLGAGGGLAIAAKFSAPLYLAAGLAALLAVRRLRVDRRAAARHFAPMVAIAIAVVWAAYAFSPDAWHTFATGVGTALFHVRGGHPSYLLGRNSPDGFWTFYIVAFLVKTPIALIVLAAAGTRKGEPLAIAVAFFIATLPVHVAIGIRHFLPVYPFIAMLAACGVARLWTSPAARVTAAVLVVWHLGATTLAHPDYIAYFNEAAAPRADFFLVDSDLDWGQDILRLGQSVDARTTPLSLAYFGTADPRRHIAIPFHMLRPGETPFGWIAVSLTIMRKGKPAGRFAFLEGSPYTMIGKSIRLYYRPPRQARCDSIRQLPTGSPPFPGARRGS